MKTLKSIWEVVLTLFAFVLSRLPMIIGMMPMLTIIYTFTDSFIIAFVGIILYSIFSGIFPAPSLYVDVVLWPVGLVLAFLYWHRAYFAVYAVVFGLILLMAWNIKKAGQE